MTIFVNFFEKMSSFWQFFDSEMAIFRRVSRVLQAGNSRTEWSHSSAAFVRQLLVNVLKTHVTKSTSTQTNHTCQTCVRSAREGNLAAHLGDDGQLDMTLRKTILMPLLYWTHFEVKINKKSELKSSVKKSTFVPNLKSLPRTSLQRPRV